MIPREITGNSRPEWSRFSFSVGLSDPLQCAGLSRRSLSPGLVVTGFGPPGLVTGFVVTGFVNGFCQRVLTGFRKWNSEKGKVPPFP